MCRKYEQGDYVQARHWWERAVKTGHADQAPRAMVGLGALERRRGDYDRARYWYRQAIATGHAETAVQARQELDALDRSDKDHQRAEHFGRYGYLAYADPDMMKRDGQP